MKKSKQTPLAILLPLLGLASPFSGWAAQAGGNPVSEQTSNSLNTIAQKAMPAVVSISAVRPAEPDKNMPLFFGGVPNGSEGQRAIGLGSGLIIRKDGIILTNNHVVENADKIIVTIDEKHKFPAKILGTDPKTDLAVIQLTGDAAGKERNYPTLSFGDSEKIRVGDSAIAIGSPFGLNRSVSSGIISAKGRGQMGILDIEDFIQTDAAINPGSSGGPLLNLNGDVVGINTAIFSQGAGFVGIGFAIPSLIAKEISEQLILKGKVVRGWAGMAAQDLNEDLAKAFHLVSTQGALISSVDPSGPAKKASLKPGDVVLRYDDKPVESASQLKSMTGKTAKNTEIPVQVAREGKIQALTLRIQEQPAPKMPQKPEQQAGKAGTPLNRIGVVVEDIPAEIAQLLNVEKGSGIIVSAVEPGSAAFDSGMSPGDVILKAEGHEVHDAKQFAKIARDLLKKDLALLYVQRGPDEKFFVTLKRDS